MKRHTLAAAGLLALATSVSAPAQAQVRLDFSLITCGDLVAADPERRDLIGAWLGGYFAASKNLDILDFQYVQRNRTVLFNYCKTHQAETVMSAMVRNWR